MSELAQQFDLHPNRIATWKKEFLSGATAVFDTKAEAAQQELEAERDKLYRQIGKLQVENDFLKKCCDEPLRATPSDRPFAQRTLDRRTVRGTGPLAQHAVLQTQACQRRGPAHHALHG